MDAYHDDGEVPDPARKDSREGRMDRITVSSVLERVKYAFDRYVSA